jgi:hypothetical protein
MARMVSQLSFVLLSLTVEFLAGKQLEQAVIHLIPSLEVCLIHNDEWDVPIHMQ